MNLRQRALRFTYEPHYHAMAKRRGWSAEEVIRRSVRRMRALIYLKVSKPNRDEFIGLSNPFIEDHGWKFMVRESLDNIGQRQLWNNQNQPH